ncbi:hypothetical protein [Natronococcus jeotgali]|uniref:hypothetical protein n=1 Tax=Natronococcus jeotgali TaxID=413812 RepID=UPI001267FEB5|nr:hypothetical protein [Natronococcus jeotgali]
MSKIYNKDSSLSYNLVVANFEKHENEQRYITWTDLDLDRLDSQEDLYQVSGHRFKQIEADNWEVSKSTVKGNSVSTETKEINVADELSTGSGVSINSSCDGWDECYKAKTTCDSYNWSCILKTAGGAATSIAACGSCFLGQLVACFAWVEYSQLVEYQ